MQPELLEPDRHAARLHRLPCRCNVDGKVLVLMHAADGLRVGRLVEQLRVPRRNSADARGLDWRVPAFDRPALPGRL